MIPKEHIDLFGQTIDRTGRLSIETEIGVELLRGYRLYLEWREAMISVALYDVPDPKAVARKLVEPDLRANELRRHGLRVEHTLLTAG